MNGNEIPHPSELSWSEDQEPAGVTIDGDAVEDNSETLEVANDLSLGDLANWVVNSDNRTLGAVNSLFMDPNLTEDETRSLLFAIHEMTTSDKSEIVYGTPETLEFVAKMEKTKVDKKTQKIYDQYAAEEIGDKFRDDYSYLALNFDEGTKLKSTVKVGAYFTGLLLALPEFFNAVAINVFAAQELRGAEARYADTRNAVAGLVVAGLGLAIKVKRKKN